MRLTIGVTGHRDLVEEEMPALRKQVRAFFIDLDQQFPGLDLQLVSPLAEGSDLLVAKVARELGIPLIAALPFEQSEYEKDFQSQTTLEGFRTLLGDAKVITMPLVAGNSFEAIKADSWSRDRQYAQLGVFISNHCQVLLALWDGRESEKTGGTAGVVNYHLTAVMPGFAVAEESPNLLADNENDLAFHIVCSRDQEAGAPADGSKPLETYWITAHFGREPGERMPAEYSDMLKRLEDFNGDLNYHQEAIAAYGRAILEGAPDLKRPDGLDFVNRLFRASDWLALHFQKRFSFGLFLNHLLAVLMGLVFIVYSEFGQLWYLVHVFLALFGVGVFIHLVGERGQWHRKYLDYRALAEGLRVQVFWNLAGVVETQSAEFAYDNFLQKQDVDLAWIRHVMRSASLRRDRENPPDDLWVPWVVEQWVGNRDKAAGQLAYYESKATQKTDNYRRTVRLGNLTLWSGILIAVVLAVATDSINLDQQHVLMILMGILPLVAAVRDAYSHKKAEKELIKQYRFMGRIFANARRLLDGSEDIEFRRRVLKAVGNAALEEHAEWILMQRERPLEHGRL